MFSLKDPIELLYFVIGLVVAITVHEFAHALVAFRLGDPTAKRHGRLTLNPIAHLDPLGTLFLILFRFGWGKPVPVDPNNFQHPRRDGLITALAGPITNLLAAATLSLAYNLLLPNLTDFVVGLLQVMIVINVLLALFNLLPVPPLDGSKIAYILFPKIDERKFEIYGMITLLALVLIFPSVISRVIWPVAEVILDLLGLGSVL